MKIHSDADSKTNVQSDKALMLNSCGLQVFNEHPYGVERQHRVDYHILLMKSGHCTVYYEGEVYTLNENDGVLYLPEQSQKYYFLEGKAESYWVHFSGTECSKLLAACGIKEGVFHTHATNEIFWTLERLIALKEQEGACAEICRAGVLIELLGYIGQDLRQKITGPSVANDLMNFIHINYTKPISFDRFAREKGIGQHRLTELFKELTGLTPHRYKLQLQLAKAKQLLLKSNLNISEIAFKIGFNDPLYFSRVFKNNIGCSPKNYK